MEGQQFDRFFSSNLICGRKEEERAKIARQWARRLLSRKETSARASEDLLEIGGDFAASALTIEEIRDLQAKLSLRPYQTLLKVALIYEVQRASLAAQNCLLKTLEEPTAHAVIILTAPDPESVLPTLRSRCRLILLPPSTAINHPHHPEKGNLSDSNNILRILKLDRRERLAWVEEHKNFWAEKETCLSLLNNWILSLRQTLLAPRKYQGVLNQTLLTVLKNILETRKTLTAVPVNLRLALEVLLLESPILNKK